MHDIEAEAEAFNTRIVDRADAGFIPDLRRNVRCEYFYKSFWRDPKFTDIYVGEMNRSYLKYIREHVGEHKRILDVGCGAGYFSLELAREGHHVLGIDIADKTIDIAKQILSENTYIDNFGSLEYKTSSIEELLADKSNVKQFDAILFSGVLHHLEDISDILQSAKHLLVEGGIILGHEPCHERWTQTDASTVVLIRGLLSLTGKWHEGIDEIIDNFSDDAMQQAIDDIQAEYVEERDKSEAGQSPHDNTFNGEQIVAEIESHFTMIETRDSSSFIYRVLGGIRSDIENEHQIAEFLGLFDKFCVANGLLNPNYFYFCAKK